MENFRSIKQWNEDDRPREKLMNKGRTALSDAELLAVLLGTGARFRDQDGILVNKSAVDLGKDILHHSDNNLLNLARMNVKELVKIPGIGEAKAISILAALELGGRRRVAKEEKVKISCSKDAYEILCPYVQDLYIEEFWVLLLNRANFVMKAFKLSAGGVAGTVVDAGPLLKTALLENARGIILCHNHPSGNLKPSQEDLSITKKLKEAARLFDIFVMDHIIISSQGYYSFGDNGQL